ncbi:MAG: hypothetical protein HQL45_09880 [Alphaproteobacteria bacterium]|nr:hypothetical protein [Alphaproteobacteria bacterium]
MSRMAQFTLGKQLIGKIAVVTGLVLIANTPFFLWRGATKHDLDIVGGQEAFGDWLIHELVTDILPLMIPLFIANLLVITWTIRKAMAPIKVLSRLAAGFDAAHLNVRLSLEGLPGEIRPLVKAVNEGLDRIEDGFKSQKRFTANAAHELRTPLAVLKARCSGEGCKISPSLSADVDRMARVVDQMLSIARLEMRQVPLDAPVDLNAICQKVVADLYPLAHDQGRDLAFLADGSWGLALGNDILLGDALRNLVENALRLSPMGETVEVELDKEGVIRVLDRGPGVPDHLKAEIFLPFRRGKSPLGGGAGLGLSIASEIVDLHGGSLAVSDRPGGGSIFTINLNGKKRLSD